MPENNTKTNTDIKHKILQLNNKYLFTGGCSRSGTSVLTAIIGAHPGVVLGMERYNKLCHKKSYAITKDHFLKERFLRMEDGDTFYNDFFRFQEHIGIPDKWDNAKYVGVKYPRIDEIIDELKISLGSITVVFIYRDVFEVAESWNRRSVESNNWPVEKDYKKAVVQWNNSLAKVKESIEKGENIICLNYEDLLFTEKSISPLFHLLELETDQKVENQLKFARERAHMVRDKKGKLTKTEYDYIKEQANLQLFHEFNEKYNVLA